MKPEDSAKAKEIILELEEAKVKIKQQVALLLTGQSQEITKKNCELIIEAYEKFLKQYGPFYKDLQESARKGLKTLYKNTWNSTIEFLKANKSNAIVANVIKQSTAKESKAEIQPKRYNKTFVISNDELTLQNDISGKFKETSGEYGYDQMQIDDYQAKVKEQIEKISSMTLTEKTFKKTKQGRLTGKPLFVSIRNKAEMAVRYEAFMNEIKELLDEGEKYAICSQHRDASLRCSPLQGLLYKIDIDPNQKVNVTIPSRELGQHRPKEIGKLDGNPYYSLKEAMSYGLFSYNCRHRLIKYIPGSKVSKQYEYNEAEASKKNKIDSDMRSYERAIRNAKENQMIASTKEDRAQWVRISKNLQAKYKAYAKANNRDIYPWRCSIGKSERGYLNEARDNEYNFEHEPKRENNNTLHAINLEVISNENYKDKFACEGLRTSDCITISNQSRVILNERNKTENESMFLVDLDSGKIIAGEEPTEPLTANRSKEMLAFPSKSDNYVVVHNHPNSTMPSGEDLTCLLRDWKNCKCCYVVCHNGDVWQYKIDKTKKQMFDKVSDMEYNRDALMDDKFMAKVLSISEEEYRANRLAEIYGLIIKRM